MKKGRADSHQSNYCERLGGEYEFSNLKRRVDFFLVKDLPRRPNGEAPKIPEQRSRSRTKSPRRRPHEEPAVGDPSYDPWKIGEEY